MRRLTALLTVCAAGLTASSATKLLPGSIDFDAPALWGKTVQWRFNDEGSLGGESHWYFDMPSESSEILQHVGTSTGYLSAFAMKGVHRTIDAVTDKEGPAVTGGRLITTDGLYIDTELTLPAYHNNGGVPRQPTVDMAKDKLVIWSYSDSEDGSAVGTLLVAAGQMTDAGELVQTNIVTDLSGLVSGVKVRLTLRAKTGVDIGGGFTGVGFEILVNGRNVTYGGGRTDFPSLQQEAFGAAAARARAGKVYSLGFIGHGEVEMLNFTQVNPIDNPEYDKDDLSMLQESAEITVNAGPTESLVGFPLLVRISEARIPGFLYERARYDGGDIRFTDENGRLVPHEIDVWRDEAGESYVWVKPGLVHRGTKLTMHWNVKTGGALPAVDATDVWSDYVAVWHMNPLGTAVKDSSGHGFTATVAEGVELTEATNAVVGRAAALAFVDGRHALESANLQAELDISGVFTFSGFYAGNGYSNNVYAATAALYGTKGTNALAKSDGWAGMFQTDTTHRYYLDNGKYVEDKDLPSVSSNWYHTAFSYDADGYSRTFFNGEARGVSKEGETLTATFEPFRVMADGLMADEVRVSRVVRSELWLATEIEQMANASFATFGTAQPKGNVNYWVEEPYVTPNSWSPEEAGTVVVSMGRARFGTVVVTYLDEAGTPSTAFPTAPGVYKAVFEAGDGVVRERISKTVNLVIYEKLAYRHVTGHDRVMLFNSDLTPGSEVTQQGFWDVDSKTNLVWSHTAEPWTGTGDFVQDGAFHTYREPETGATLWEFRHARIGNLFPGDEPGLAAGQNLLPWNAAFARRYDDSEKPANRQRYAGWLILQNVAGDDPAAAYSPVYSNGVGTVYFDVVNAYTAFTNAVKVQVSHAVSSTGRVQDGAWTDVPLTVLKVVDGAYDAGATVSNATAAALAVTAPQGSTNAFYRVRAVLDTIEPTRLRIVRADSAWGTDGEDGPGLVIVDNIIASGPAMGVSIEQYGAPAIPRDAAFRGQRAPFSVPFPAVSDLGTLRAMVKVNYIVNGTNTADAAFVGSLMMRYRWRYLDQAVDEWKDVVLRASEGDITRFVSTDPLEGQGLGDIEYAFTGVVNAPYYDYVDYSGLGLGWGDGFTERRGNVEINAKKDGVYSDDQPSPALGTDYFVRLREGKSAYERFTLRVRKDGNVDTVPMALVSDGVWRGFWLMPTNWAGQVEWQMEAANPQAEAGNWQWATNFFCGSEDKKELPVNDVLVAGDPARWTKVPSDAVTGYLMFQVDEGTRAVTVIHADYQNVNAWSDANRADGDINGHFVGTSTADDEKAGVSRQTRTFSDAFADLSATVPTNAVLWEEHFNVPPSLEGKYAVETPFSTLSTPNGWGADNGMWMPQEFRDMAGDSIALQLEGEGRGHVRFAIANSPRGIATFTYRARNAQTYDIFSFDYYRGTNEFYYLSDYTFAVPCVMRHGEHGDFEGLGSVSAVGYYDDGKGCYEARVDRVSRTAVRIRLYKWYAEGTKILSELMAESTAETDYAATGLNGVGACGAILISCENFDEIGQTRIQGGVYTGTKITRADVANQVLSGKQFLGVSAIDEDDNRHTCGTFGVGSKNCPAAFAAPQLYRKPVPWSASGGKRTMTFDAAPSVKQLLIDDEDGYDAWTIRQGRLEAKKQTEAPQGWGFVAVPSKQTLSVEVAPKSTQDYRTIALNEVSTFGFQTFTNALYLAETVDVRLSTGGTRGDGSGEVTVDDFVAVQWRGNSYDDGENRSLYANVNRGAPTNFVYTTAWVDEMQNIELSPMRTLADQPASIRAPLMDGADGRGLGLGMLAFSYRDANPHARLIVQVATNGVDVTTLSDYSARFAGWTDIKTIDFKDFSEEQLRSGLISCYIGLHGVKGVMRVVVDPVLVAAAQDPVENPGHDPEFGRVFITDVSARDNPYLDAGCWWGWNLRTTDDGLFQLLEDGARETATWGMSLGLNNSIKDDVRADERDAYPKHPPFLQTPVFTKGAVGQLTFKARKYSPTDPSPTVAIYGTTKLGTVTDDADFERVGEVVVTSDRFERYDFTASLTKNYTGFRLVVTGVAGVDNPGPTPASGYVERVLIDEVAVFEAIRARMGFRNVGAFRSGLSTAEPVPNVPSRSEQPMCDEAFGIQTELYVAQLANTIDTSRAPEVYLHWYEGASPWGYSRWAGEKTAKTAQLLRVGGETNWVYRSSYTVGEGTVIPAMKTPGQVVQYSLDVVFYMKDAEDPITNTLSSAEWPVPDWFRPVDYNQTLGKGDPKLFSAFTILDTVAPGWAWLNEVNLYGDRVNYINTDTARQYIEIAAPAEADLSGWSVRLLTPETSSDSVYTNTLATFGMPGLDGRKKDNVGQASNMVFRVIANRATRDAGELKTADGTLDGVWSVQVPSAALDADGTINYYQAFGLQLVRPSGVVEHEIVSIGTNLFETSVARAQYHPTNVVKFLNRTMPAAEFFHAGNDDGGLLNSLGVFVSRGETKDCWTNSLAWTPGRINVGQVIDPDHPTPSGDAILVYANLATDHIHQSVDRVLVVPKGSEVGTNIFYTTDRWYGLGSVTTNGVAAQATATGDAHVYVLNVGRGCSNNVTVEASAAVDERLRELGLDEKNRYTPAIMKWLETACDIDGNDWPEGDEIYLADVLDLGHNVVTNLSLTEMYWLDMCPTITNQCLIAGMLEAPTGVIQRRSEESRTNLSMTAYMMMSNCTDDVHSPYYGMAWRPTVLRGLEPGSSSRDYADAKYAWTSETFKVTGLLMNGLTSCRNPANWIPVRFFVFDENSFTADGRAEIQVDDPHTSASPGYTAGWGEWFRQHPEDTSPIVFGWTIDTRLMPITVEMLRPKNPKY